MLNIPNRTFYQGDNIDFMRGINGGSVDLIATDPPFQSGADYIATEGTGAAGSYYTDTWQWQDENEENLKRLPDNPAALVRLAKDTHSDGMAAYIQAMAIRLIEMHRILKPAR